MAKDSGGGGELITLGLIGIGAWIFWPTISSLLGLTSSTAAAANTSNITGTGTAASPSTTTTSTSTPASTGQLDQAYTAMVAAATAAAPATGVSNNQLQLVNGQPQTTWGGWNYYLNQVAPAITNLPDYQTVTGQTDLGLPMSGPQYWALMAPWLQTNRGLSGLGVFGGLGMLARRHGLGYFGRR